MITAEIVRRLEVIPGFPFSTLLRGIPLIFEDSGLQFLRQFAAML